MSNNGLTVTVASDPTLYYPEGFRIIVYGTVILVGRTQEVKVGVDPLAIILSGPLGKFVLSILATLGSVRSGPDSQERDTSPKRHRKCFTKARVTGDSQGTYWCFYVHRLQQL